MKGSETQIRLITIDSSLSLCPIEMPTRIIYKRRKEKERRLAKLLLIATAVLAIGGAGIAACFTAIGHVDAVQRSELPEFSWKKWYQRGEFDWDAQEVGSTYHKNRRNREEVGRSLRNCRSARRSSAKRQELPTTLRYSNSPQGVTVR